MEDDCHLLLLCVNLIIQKSHFKKKRGSSRPGKGYYTQGATLVYKDHSIDLDAITLGNGTIDLPANCVLFIFENMANMAKVREQPENEEYRIVTDA